MMQVSPFRADDLAALAGHDLCWHERNALAEAYEQGGEGYTVRRAGRIIACCGAAKRHAGHVSLWAFYATGLSRREWGWLLKATRHYIDSLPQARIDAVVVGSASAMVRRWAAQCGLTFDFTMRRGGPDGADLDVYWRESA
jgi:hypothetical protein